jgi:hypothetical protein
MRHQNIIWKESTHLVGKGLHMHLQAGNFEHFCEGKGVQGVFTLHQKKDGSWTSLLLLLVI